MLSSMTTFCQTVLGVAIRRCHCGRIVQNYGESSVTPVKISN